MAFVKKHFSKIICVAILLCCYFLPFISAPNESGGIDKITLAWLLRYFYVMPGGAYIFLTPACALAVLICECLKKYKVSAILTVGGFISLLLAPKAVFNFIYDDADIAKEYGVKRSGGFVLMLLLYILLLIIAVVRFINSSSSSSSNPSDSTDDSKVDLNK